MRTARIATILTAAGLIFSFLCGDADAQVFRKKPVAPKQSAETPPAPTKGFSKKSAPVSEKVEILSAPQVAKPQAAKTAEKKEGEAINDLGEEIKRLKAVNENLAGRLYSVEAEMRRINRTQRDEFLHWRYNQGDLNRRLIRDEKAIRYLKIASAVLAALDAIAILAFFAHMVYINRERIRGGFRRIGERFRYREEE